MKKSKKILALLLAVIMLVTVVPLTVFAATSGEWEYEVLEDGTAEITKYTGSAKKIDIPDKIDGHTVTSIGYYAFAFCTSLESVTIPNSVTGIESDAFRGCTSLTKVEIGNSVTNIEDDMFYECSSLKEISVSADNKAYCSLDGVLFNKDKTQLIKYPQAKVDESYQIPESVTHIGYIAFDGCTSLTNIIVGKNVMFVSGSASFNCISLKEINVVADNTAYTSIDGVLFNKDKTELISYPSGKVNKTYQIPNGVTSIFCTFENCASLENITIPESLTTDDWHISCCNSLREINVVAENIVYSSINGVLFNKDKTELIRYPAGKTDETYQIPNSVTGVENRAFEDCTLLKEVIIPNSVVNIGEGAFAYCTSLISIKIPDSVTSIGYVAFADCTSLKSVIIGNGVTDIDNLTFNDCTSLKSVEVSDSITSIAYNAFYGCTSLCEINVSDHNKEYSSLDGVLFNKDKTVLVKYPQGKTDKSYQIPDGVTSIDGEAFISSTSITNVEIPNSVTYIGIYAFACCNSLKSVYIPSTVTVILDQAFGWTDVNLKPKGILENLFGINHLGGSGDYEEGYSYKVPNFTIYGVKGTEAERYAKDNEFKFVEITETIPGDISGDGVVSADDAIVIQRHIAGLETLGADQLKNADLNGDGIVDEGDAIAILRIDAGLAS